MTPDEYCRDKAASSGSSFYYSFLFLAPDRRRAITALYAFCREVDDIVDETEDPQIAATKLAWWRNEIANLFAGKPQHPVARALEPDEHRQIDPGDDLDILAFHQADGEVRRGAAEQVGQDDHALALVARLDGVGDVLAPRFHVIVRLDADTGDRLLRADDMFHGRDELGRESAMGHQH